MLWPVTASIVVAPALAVVVQAFAKGLGVFLANFQSEELLSALKLTLIVTAIVPIVERDHRRHHGPIQRPPPSAERRGVVVGSGTGR